MPIKEKASSSTAEKKSFLDFCTQNSKKVIIATVIVAGAALAAAGAIYSFYSKDVVATVGAEKITRNEYFAKLSNCNKFYAFNQAKELEKKCETSSLQELIEAKVMKLEAEKRGITVTEEEINSKLKEMAAEYGSKDKLLRVASQFDLNEEELKENAKNQLLRSKLEAVVLNNKEIWGPFVRWDIDINGKSDKATNGPIAKAKIEKYFTPLMQNNPDRAAINASLGELAKEGAPWDLFNRTGIIDENSLNKATAKNAFGSLDDWNAVKDLKQGDVSPVVISENGYAVIYKVSKVVNGGFDTWEEFVNSYNNKALTLDPVVNTKMAFSSISEKVVNLKGDIAKVLQPNKAYAECNNNHFSQFDGKAYDFVNNKYIPWVTVKASANQPGDIACGPTSAQVGSGGDGTFSIGSNSNVNGSNTLNCYSTWDVEVSKANYYTIKWHYKSLGANGSTKNLDAMVSTGRTNGIPDEWIEGNYNTGENTNNNRIIALKPTEVNVAPTPEHLSPGNGATVDAPCDSNIASVNFHAKATDQNGDAVKLRMAYSSDYVNWKYMPSEGNTGNHTPILYTNLVDQGSDADLGTVSLAAGTYYWRVWAMDEHGMMNPKVNGNEAEYAGTWSFTVRAGSACPVDTSKYSHLSVRVASDGSSGKIATPHASRRRPDLSSTRNDTTSSNITLNTTDSSMGAYAYFTDVQPGYYFQDWSSSKAGKECGPNNPTVFNKEEETSVVCTANFRYIDPNIAMVRTLVSPAAAGRATDSSLVGNTRYSDDEVYPEVRKNSGYTFSRWDTNVTNSSNKTVNCEEINSSDPYYRARVYLPRGTTGEIVCTAVFTADNQPPQVFPDSPANGQVLAAAASTDVNLVAHGTDDGGLVSIYTVLHKLNKTTNAYEQVTDFGWSLPYASNNSPVTRTASGLTPGDYRWAVEASDGELYSNLVEWTFTIPEPAAAPTLTCSILPTGGGQAPLVVQVSYSVTNPTGAEVSINMGDGVIFNKPGGTPAPGSVFNSTPFYYTYKTANTYNATFNLIGSTATCNQTARVIDPNGGSGGEVSP